MGRPRKPPPDYIIPLRRKSRPIKLSTLQMVDQMHQLIIGGAPVQRAAIDVLAAVTAEHRERGTDHFWLPSHKVLMKRYYEYEAALIEVYELNAVDDGLNIKLNLLNWVIDECGYAVDIDMDHPASWYPI